MSVREPVASPRADAAPRTRLAARETSEGGGAESEWAGTGHAREARGAGADAAGLSLGGRRGAAWRVAVETG